MHDVVIIGAGPGGMTSALYSSRANMDTILLDRGVPGGQLQNTEEIENFPGFSHISGPDLAQHMFEHSQKFGAKYQYGDVKKISKESDVFTIHLGGEKKLLSKAVIIATGTQYKKLGIPGEEEFTGRGVSWCAVCDGAFYRDKHVVVIGGGDSAVEEANYLTKFASKVTIFHRRDRFSAQSILVDRVLKNPKVNVEFNTVVNKILGENKVTGVEITQHWFQPMTKNFQCDGVFEYIGMNPISSFVKDLNITDKDNWIITDNRMQTSIPGLFAIGDVRSGAIRQVVTATGDGCIAAQSAQDYIESMI